MPLYPPRPTSVTFGFGYLENNTPAVATDAGSSVAVGANEIVTVDMFVMYSCDTTTNGIKVVPLQYPTFSWVGVHLNVQNSVSGQVQYSAATLGSPLGGVLVTTAGSIYSARLSVCGLTSTSGSLLIGVNGQATGTIAVRAGSWVRVTRTPR